MTTTSCPKCNKQFVKDTPLKAEQALQMHNYRAHTRAGKRQVGSTARAKVRYGKKDTSRFALAAKARWKRHKVHTNGAEQAPQFDLNHCPNCGCPMRGARIGLRTDTAQHQAV